MNVKVKAVTIPAEELRKNVDEDNLSSDGDSNPERSKFKAQDGISR
jgi:hypothetical protein